MTKNLFLGGFDVYDPKGIKCKNNISIMHEKENGISIDHTDILPQKKCDTQCNPSGIPDNAISKESGEGNKNAWKTIWIMYILILSAYEP